MNVGIYQDFSIYFLVCIPNLSINGTWQDIDNSFKDPDANEDIRATISKDTNSKIAGGPLTEEDIENRIAN